MTKNFCDICGEPAINLYGGRTAGLNVGSPWRGYVVDRGEGIRQCVAVANLSFSFRDHEKDFGGPPDLCPAHAYELALLVANKLKS